MSEYKGKNADKSQGVTRTQAGANKDEGTGTALAQERGDLVANMIIERSKVRSEIQQILTDTQREQMKQMR